MKDLTSILLIGGIGAVVYYGYQNNWFGNSTAAAAPAATTPVVISSSPNLVPIATLTPPQPTPTIAPLPPPHLDPIKDPRIPPYVSPGPILDPGPGTLATNSEGQQIMVYGNGGNFRCPPNADCGPLGFMPITGSF